MKTKIVLAVFLIVFTLSSCTSTITTVPIATTTQTSTFTPIPPALTSTPTLTPTYQPQSISKEKLNCSSLGIFTKCVDDVLAIEFEYPTAWGEIFAELRTGGYSGYAYDYYYGGKTIAETEPLVAGGRSKDFSEGRGGTSTDFGGYGDTGMQLKESCNPSLKDLFPICEQVIPDVTWMIRLPNAKYICNSSPGFYTTPVFRIELNLPNNPTINGFVFEAPFWSEKFFNQIKGDLYPLLGMGSDMFPKKCNEADKQAFDNQLALILESIEMGKIDKETQQLINEVIHMAKSIKFR